MNTKQLIQERQNHLQQRLQGEARALSRSVPCNYARRHPFLGTGGAALLGVVAGKTLRSTSNGAARSGKWIGQNLVRAGRIVLLSALTSS